MSMPWLDMVLGPRPKISSFIHSGNRIFAFLGVPRWTRRAMGNGRSVIWLAPRVEKLIGGWVKAAEDRRTPGRFARFGRGKAFGSVGIFGGIMVVTCFPAQRSPAWPARPVYPCRARRPVSEKLNLKAKGRGCARRWFPSGEVADESHRVSFQACG